MKIEEKAQKEPNSLIGQAYYFAKLAHKGQLRKSGEPYFSHVLATAEILNEWQLDEATITAGILHDVLEDTNTTPQELKERFSEEIFFLVDGVSKLGKIKFKGGDILKAENMRKMILAISQDLRVVFIKIADRLHNMRTIAYLPKNKQKRIALETDEIYAPLAYHLGMTEVSGELKDLAFPILYPKENKWINEHIKEEYESRKKYLESFEPQIRKILEEAGITPLAIDFRAKRHYSLYQKLLRYDMDIERIYDLVALRIILKEVGECYAALGIIHQNWPPLPGRIKDYIATPKSNNYRSLHTTIIGPQGKYIEIQLRTQEMHKESEYGIAAHWLYKEKHKGHNYIWVKKIKDTLSWIKQLKEWQEKYFATSKTPTKFIETMKVEFFKDRVFVITPKGDVVDLPEGSTPVDFAYKIHSDIGNSCVGAKVNGSFVPLNYRLKSGEVVEILTQKNKKPSPDWLNFVKTSTARENIKSVLREKKTRFIQKRQPTKCEFRITVEDRIGLLRDITSVISKSKVNILKVTTANPGNSRFPMDRIECSLTDKKRIEALLLRIKKIKGVKEVSYRLI